MGLRIVWLSPTFSALPMRKLRPTPSPSTTPADTLIDSQFGNMLVLAAAYGSSLSELVEREKLEWLLKRTIKFLIRYQNVSPTLRADARILTEIYLKIFREHPKLD